jgi:LPXTG-motif cell wall-anchored protein
MLLAAMLAMVLAAAAPALGQQIGGDQGPVAGDDAVQAGDNVQYAAVCQNIIGSFQASAGQGATAGSFASAGENAAAVAEIAQNQNVSVEQANECLNAWFASASAHGSHHTATATATAGGGGGGGSSASASATALPSTGGPVPSSSALALGAGALLVAGGLLARRIVR